MGLTLSPSRGAYYAERIPMGLRFDIRSGLAVLLNDLLESGPQSVHVGYVLADVVTLKPSGVLQGRPPGPCDSEAVALMAHIPAANQGTNCAFRSNGGQPCGADYPESVHGFPGV